jgi:hypothetical protein
MEQAQIEALKRQQDHVEGLKRVWGGPMTEKEVAFLRDLQSFIEFCIRNGLSFPLTLSTIGHDVNNLMREEICFTPKVTGYAKIMQDLENVRNDPELQRELRQLY